MESARCHTDERELARDGVSMCGWWGTLWAVAVPNQFSCAPKPHNCGLIYWSWCGACATAKRADLAAPCPFLAVGWCCALLRYRWLWAKMGASSFSVREEWVCPSWAESQTKISINAYKLYTKLHKYCHMFHAVCAWQKTPPSATAPSQSTKMSVHWIFKGFSLQFSSYHNHSIANLDKLILLFSKMTLDTAIKATASSNISIQICKTQGKQIALRAAELIKRCFLWICILSAAVALHCSNSSHCCPDAFCALPHHGSVGLAAEHCPAPRVTCSLCSLLAGLEAACAVSRAQLLCLLPKRGKKSYSRILLMVELTSLLLSPSHSCHLQKRVGISLWNLLIFFVFHSFLFQTTFWKGVGVPSNSFHV